MTNQEISEFISEMFYDTDRILLLDSESADAFIGITTNGAPVYSFEKLVKTISEKFGISEEEALDYISYNTLRSIDCLPEGYTAPVIIYGFYENTSQDQSNLPG